MIKNYSQKRPGPHSLQNMVENMGLYKEALNDNRVLNAPDEKIKTSNWGKKSYADNSLSLKKLF